ncbi:MAG: SRPBCC family protein [Acetobacteraceae bacterium]|jgi:uncharacterized protein YndB with AHSA1/START domain
MSGRSTHHATFVIERVYAAPPVQVFNAWADPTAKAGWFAGPDEWVTIERKSDFRVGGSECVRSGPPGGTVHAFDCRYHEIVPNERIVYSYDMHLDAKRISVSLTTVEFKPADAGTRLIFTEQVVFLDGYDDAGAREQGTRGLLDKLGAALERGAGG